jgi:protoheme ferro-lyase
MNSVAAIIRPLRSRHNNVSAIHLCPVPFAVGIRETLYEIEEEVEGKSGLSARRMSRLLVTTKLREILRLLVSSSTNRSSIMHTGDIELVATWLRLTLPNVRKSR